MVFRVPVFVSVLLCLGVGSTVAAGAAHPWLPPFGLDRVGARGPSSDPFEADAAAEAESIVNPVDLGTVLVPHGWLLLGPDQAAVVRVAAFSRDRDQPAQVAAWFESSPDARKQVDVNLVRAVRGEARLLMPGPATPADRDVLHVIVADREGGELFHKRITTMLVHKAAGWPAFGATETLLRYDAPISLRDARTGTLSTMPYDRGWDAKLKDVVVSLPNGSRFVFWRGASYVPFWASRYNTALCYEWAETGPLPDGFVDAVEPLMDKELRYGRVEIVESTEARVHVRWAYQSTDFQYKVWGDLATEDFYFYPDGFGTRVLTLKSGLNADYELSEFIILTPQDAYPFDVLAANSVDAVFLDGEKRGFVFPFEQSAASPLRKPRDIPAVWRVRLNKRDPMTAVYFNAADRTIPGCIFGPFRDKGEIVTPAYWGSHWPLARGKTTGGAIDDRIHVTPAHNSLMSWARTRPTPLVTATMPSIDTLGRSRPMRIQQWAWLIGMSEEPDAALLVRARSFATPPSLEVEGARLPMDSYATPRRAMQLVVESQEVTITLTPQSPCVNPVFELVSVPGRLRKISLDGQELRASDYRWDGSTLWVNRLLSRPARLALSFGK